MSDFDADWFRGAIRDAMVMGLPQAVSDRPTFQFADGRTFTPMDSAGQPYDWTVTPEGEPPKPDVQVTCAVQLGGAGVGTTDVTAVGELNQNEAILYFFEDEWAQVWDFTTVLLGGDEYGRVSRLPPLGLYSVQIEQVKVRARDEA